MGKRVVQECDLTKQEYDPAETVTVIIKKNGKKTGRTYELSSEAAAKLEQQLVSGKKLNPTWGFHDFKAVQGRTIGDFENESAVKDNDEDATFVAEKKRSMKDEGVDITPREKEEGQPIILAEMGSDSTCLHMNKGPVQITMKNGDRHFYRTCKACRKSIPEKPKNERTAYLSAEAPADSKFASKDERFNDE